MQEIIQILKSFIAYMYWATLGFFDTKRQILLTMVIITELDFCFFTYLSEFNWYTRICTRCSYIAY